MHLILKKLGMGNYQCLYKGRNKEFSKNLHFALSRSNKNEKYLYFFVSNLEDAPVE